MHSRIMKLATKICFPLARFVPGLHVQTPLSCVILLTCTLFMARPIFAACPDPLGDLNGNGDVNIVDAQCAILTALWALGGYVTSPPQCLIDPTGSAADVNCDGQPNIVDVQLIIAVALNQPLDPAIDGNGNGCPDVCEEPECGDANCDPDETCYTCEADCGGCEGSCCEANGTIGCNDSGVQSCVCESDPYCCEVVWDDVCAQQVNTLGCGVCILPGDCCEPGLAAGCEDTPCQECVCVVDDVCCLVAWDSTCVDVAATTCNDACGCAPTCCDTASDEPGCNDPACESCVCDIDSFCCDIAWDDICVALANLECPGECGCEVVLPGDCCEVNPSGGPGCLDEVCQTCACDIDPFCCEVSWDANCVELAETDCQAECGCVPPPQGDCCSVSENPGCSEATCEQCVCTIDPFCCDAAWDDVCVSEALSECPTECQCPTTQGCCQENSFGLPGCNQPICQDCVCTFDSFCCDVAWDSGCVVEAETTCNVFCGCVPPPQGDCCTESEAPGCTNPTCEACVCNLDAFCCDTAWDTICVAEAEVDCAADCNCAPAPNDCCVTHESGGCDEPDCEACVCTIDLFCCAVSWDEVCAAAALFDCGPVCTCSEVLGGSCCAPNAQGNPGCNEAACESCVCATDAFCCDVFYDDNCSTIATFQCTAVCTCAGQDCCEPSPTAESGCNDVSCETCVCLIDSFCCDAAWDDVCANLALSSCASSCTCAPPIPGDCCEANPDDLAGCDDPGCEACVCASDNFCCDVSWDEVCASEATGACADECLCANGGVADCCIANPVEGPGCNDSLCEQCVCLLDLFCCNVFWDDVCAVQAQEDCGASCACASVGLDCCAPSTTDSPGCSDPGCESCVCNIDPFCCDVLWDDLCVEEAQIDCAAICPCGP